MGVIMKNGVMYGQMNDADGIHVTDTLGVLGVVDADVILQDLIDAMADSVADVTVSGSNIVITMLDGTTTNLIAISNTAVSGSSDLITSGGVYSEVQALNADLANKQDASTAVRSVNSNLPTNGEVTLNAEDIPADGIGDKSVSGNPITIEDGMASVAKELSVTLEPIQDLHGYESPWIGTDVDKAPYLFRAVSESSVQDKGTHEMDKLVGGTVAWNQLFPFDDDTFATNGVTWTIKNGKVTVSGTFAVSTSFSIFPDRVYNQLKLKKDHKYLLYTDGTTNGTRVYAIYYASHSSTTLSLSSGSRIFNVPYDDVTDSEYVIGALKGIEATGEFYSYLIDLTQMFGSTIADYIYSLEQSTAGAGVAWFRRLFPAPYYPYNAGTLMSVKTSAHITRGFNQWDEEWEVGSLVYNKNASDFGEPVAVTSQIRAKNFIPVSPSTVYSSCVVSKNAFVIFYDKNKTAIPSYGSSGYQVIGAPYNGNVFTTPSNCYYARFYCNVEYGTTYNHDICINLSKTTGTPKNGDYVAYDGHSYALDSDLELRGIPKLDSNNNLYYDGDVYEASGNVQRKYGIVDLGTQTWSMSGDSRPDEYLWVCPYLSDKAFGQFNLITSRYPVDYSASSPYDIRDKYCAGRSNNVNVYICDNSFTTAEAFTTAMSGVYLVYELATPTSETVDPYTSMQVIDTSGTEEYVDSRTVPIPVGHESAYANVCPIEGRTGTEVQRNSPNIWGGEKLADDFVTKVPNATKNTTNKTVTYAAAYVNNVILFDSFNPNTRYTLILKGMNLDSTSTATNLQFVYSDGSIESPRFTTAGENSYAVYNSANGKTVKRITGRWTTSEVVLKYEECGLFEGVLTVDDFEPYSEDTASVTFGQTVYGCTHDFVTGKCRVTHASIDLGTISWGLLANNSHTFRTSLSNLNIPSGNMMSDRYKSLGQSLINDSSEDKVIGIALAGTTGVRIHDSAYDNATDFEASLSGAQLVYELAEPVELTLTPAQLTLLQGTNILTADGTINLTYLGSMASDVQAEIDEFEAGLNNVIGSIAFIENSTAKTSHAVGEYVIMNGIFCKVIASISAGETLSFGTNIRATTIGAELKAIWAEISA